MRASIEHLALFGPGLIGGSVALAAYQRGLCARLSVWSRDPAERDAVRALDLADLVTGDPAEAVHGADLVVLCTPPAALAALAREIVPHLQPGAAVTDVASVKAGVADELTAIFHHAAGLESTGRSAYAGSHPMAGAERHGLQAARADLFDGAVCLLTPDPCTAPGALERVDLFWRGLGARVRTMSPQAHDDAVALVSHLPHVLAAALVDFVGGEPVEPADCAGPGWRDMTRLAGGSPELWTEILSRNRGPVTYALRGLIDRLRAVLEVVETGRDADLEAFLDGAKTRRARKPSAGR